MSIDHRVISPKDIITISDISETLASIGIYKDIAIIIKSYLYKYTKCEKQDINFLEKGYYLTHLIDDVFKANTCRFDSIRRLYIINENENFELQPDEKTISADCLCRSVFKHKNEIYIIKFSVTYHLQIDRISKKYCISEHRVYDLGPYQTYIIMDDRFVFSSRVRDNIIVYSIPCVDMLFGKIDAQCENITSINSYNPITEEYLKYHLNHIIFTSSRKSTSYIGKRTRFMSEWIYYYYNHFNRKFYKYLTNKCFLCGNKKEDLCYNYGGTGTSHVPANLRFSKEAEKTYVQLPYHENHIEIPHNVSLDIFTTSFDYVDGKLYYHSGIFTFVHMFFKFS